MLRLAFALALTYLNGVYVARRFWPAALERTAAPGLTIWRHTLAILLGLTVQSLLSYISLLATGSVRWGLVGELMLVGLLVRALGQSSVGPRPAVASSLSRDESASSSPTAGLWQDRVTRFLPLALLAGGACVAVTQWIAMPHGYWDAWSMWTVRAVFLAEAGDEWPSAFGPDLDHSDYPPLVPLVTARFMAWMGGRSVVAPGLTQGLFFLCLVGSMYGGLAQLRGRFVASVGTCLILLVAGLWTWSVALYADIPFACLLLAIGVVWALLSTTQEPPPRALALLGWLAAAAAWTKNEGLLFLGIALAATVAARGIHRRPRDTVREMLFVVLGALPLGMALLHFKLSLAGENDLVQAQSWQRVWETMAAPARWSQIGTSLAAVAASHLSPGLVPALAAVFWTCGWRPVRSTAWCPLAAAILLAAGYLYFLVTTPHDLKWHLQTSASRLLVHLAPLTVLAALLLVRPPHTDSRAGEFPKTVGRRCSPTGYWVTLALLALSGIFAIDSLPSHPLFRQFRSAHQDLVTTHVEQLRSILPPRTRVQFVEPPGMPQQAAFILVSLRYYLAPHRVTKDQDEDWVVAAHASNGAAETFQDEHHFALVRDLGNGLRLLRRAADRGQGGGKDRQRSQ